MSANELSLSALPCLFVWLALTPSLAAPPLVTSFPGDVTSILSPDGKFRLFYLDPGRNADGIHEYKLMLESTAQRHGETIDVFTRSADISWSPDSRSAYVNDFIGSNLSDCLILTKRNDAFSVISLRSRILRNAVSGPAPMLSLEIRNDSHAYVSCEDWKPSGKLAVTLSGHIDSAPSAEFEYHYLYDMGQDRLVYQK